MVAQSAHPEFLFNEDTRFYRSPTPLPPESPLRELSPTPDWDQRYPFIALLDGTIPQFAPDQSETPGNSIMWLPEDNQQSPSLLLPSSGEDDSDNTPLINVLPTISTSVSFSSTNPQSASKPSVTSKGYQPTPKNIDRKKQYRAKRSQLATTQSQAKEAKHPMKSSNKIKEDDSDNTPLAVNVKSANKKPKLVKAKNPSQTFLLPRRQRQEEEPSVRKPWFPNSRGSEQERLTQKVKIVPEQLTTVIQRKKTYPPFREKSLDPHTHPKGKHPSQIFDRKRGKQLPSASSIMRKNVTMGKKPKAYDRPRPVARQAQVNKFRSIPTVIKKSLSSSDINTNNRGFKKNTGYPKKTPRIRPSQLGISKGQGVTNQSTKRKTMLNNKPTFEGRHNQTSQDQPPFEPGFWEGTSDPSCSATSNQWAMKNNKKRNRRPSSLPASQPRKRLQTSKKKPLPHSSKRPTTSERSLYKPGVESMNLRRNRKQKLPSLVEMCQSIIKVNREALLLKKPIKMHLSKGTIKAILNSFNLRHHEILCQIAELNPRWRQVMEPLWEKVCDTTYPQFKSKKPEGMTYFTFHKKWLRHRKRAKLKAAIALKGQKADNAGTRKVNVLTMQETKKMFPKKKRRRRS